MNASAPPWARRGSRLHGFVAQIGLMAVSRLPEGSVSPRMTRSLQRWLAGPLAPGLSAMDGETFVALVRNDPEARAVISQSPKELSRLSPRALLDVARIPELGSLVARALMHSTDLAQRSEVLYDAIVLRRAEVGPSTLAAAYRTASRVPETISSPHASSILRQCLTLASVQTDPYEAPSLNAEAMAAAAAILQHHPELDSIVAQRAATASPGLLAITASAIQRRPASRVDLFRDFLVAWKPTWRNAERFAADCDSRFSASDPALDVDLDVSRRLPSAAVATGARFLPWCAGPFIGLIGWLLVHFTSLSVGGGIGYGVTIGALGLLIAANVVAMELSATRLPGLIAQYSVARASLRMAQSCAIWMSVLLVVAEADEDVANEAGGAKAALFLGLVILLVEILSALIRRIDSGEAATVFGRARRISYRRSGERMGRFYKEAVSTGKALHGLSHVEVVTSPPASARRVPVVASTRGVLLPSIRRIEHLEGAPLWSTGRLRLQVKRSLGGFVNPGEEIGAVVATPDSAVPKDALRAAERALRPHPAGDIDEVGEACTTLIRMAVALAEKGDERGAARTAQTVRSLLLAHMKGISSTRGPASSTRVDAGPLIPSLASVARAIVDEFMKSETVAVQASLRNILTSTLDGARNLRFPMIAAALLPRPPQGPGSHARSSRIVDLAKVIGTAAIEADDSVAITMCCQTIKRIASDDVDESASAVEASAYLCATAVWRNYFRMIDLWDRFVDAGPEDKHRAERAMGCLRIGAAGLLSGNLSIALASASYLHDRFDLDLVERLLRARGTLEQFLSDQQGHYLGEDAEAAQARFLDLARAVLPSIARTNAA